MKVVLALTLLCVAGALAGSGRQCLVLNHDIALGEASPSECNNDPECAYVNNIEECSANFGFSDDNSDKKYHINRYHGKEEAPTKTGSLKGCCIPQKKLDEFNAKKAEEDRIAEEERLAEEERVETARKEEEQRKIDEVRALNTPGAFAQSDEGKLARESSREANCHAPSAQYLSAQRRISELRAELAREEEAFEAARSQLEEISCPTDSHWCAVWNTVRHGVEPYYKIGRCLGANVFFLGRDGSPYNEAVSSMSDRVAEKVEIENGEFEAADGKRFRCINGEVTAESSEEEILTACSHTEEIAMVRQDANSWTFEDEEPKSPAMVRQDAFYGDEEEAGLDAAAAEAAPAKLRGANPWDDADRVQNMKDGVEEDFVKGGRKPRQW